MNRRHFCKIASLAAASLGLSRLESQAKTLSLSPLPALPRACRISIVRREFHPDLQTTFQTSSSTTPTQGRALSSRRVANSVSRLTPDVPTVSVRNSGPRYATLFPACRVNYAPGRSKAPPSSSHAPTGRVRSLSASTLNSFFY